jgi:hypothetical protein
VEVEVEWIDRIYLNSYVPQLQHDEGVVGFFRYHGDIRLPPRSL